jgi:hypothetical protein
MLVSFSSEKRLYKFSLLPSIGAIWKIVRSKKANTKFTCVYIEIEALWLDTLAFLG